MGTNGRVLSSLCRTSVTLLPSSKPAAGGDESALGVESRRRDLLELSIGYGLILLTAWTPQPWQRLFYWAALGWVLLATAFSFDGLSAMGLRISGSLRSLWVVGLALVVAAAAFGVAGQLHTLHYPVLLVQRYCAYSVWAFLQEFLLMDIFLLRLLRLLPGTKLPVLAAAGMFAVAHLPNPILAPVTLLWGIAACLLFLRYRNLYTLAMAHAVFGICIAATVPGPVDHNMRVGLGYLYYRPPARLPAQHQRSQIDHIVSTQAWVVAEAATRRSSRQARP